MRRILSILAAAAALVEAAPSRATDCDTISGNELSPCGFENAAEVAAWPANAGTAVFAPGAGETGGAAQGTGQDFGSTRVFRRHSPCIPAVTGDEFDVGYWVKHASGTPPVCRAAAQFWTDAACTSPNGAAGTPFLVTADSSWQEVTATVVAGDPLGPNQGMQMTIECRTDADFEVLVDNAYAVRFLPEIVSARVEPVVVRTGVDTFTLTVGTSDPDVVQVTIDMSDMLTIDGLPVTEVVLLDDGLGPDAVADDQIFTADGIGLQNAPDQLGGQVIRFRNIDLLLSDLSTRTVNADLGLTLHYMDASVPVPAVTDVAPDARASAHAVSLLRPLDGNFPDHTPDRILTAQHYYGLFPDDLDWLVIATPANTAGPAGLFWPVRNDVQEIGLDLVDDSNTFGSNGVLRGIVELAYATIADHATLNHEVAHQFAAHLDDGLDLADAGGHWDVVTAPSSALGFGTYTDIDPIGAFTFRALTFGTLGQELSELELYLMGLVDVSEVTSPIQTLANPIYQYNEPQLCDPRGCDGSPDVYQADALRDVTTAEIVAAEGVRVPDVTGSPKQFRAGFVVVYDRLLTDVELAFFEHAMSEYEKPVSTLGLSFQALTGNRASISTIAVPEPGVLPSLVCGIGLLRALQRRRARAKGAHPHQRRRRHP